MALAMLYPNGHRGRGKVDPARKTVDSTDFSYERLKQARAVLAHSRALAEDALADRVPLDNEPNEPNGSFGSFGLRQTEPA